MSRNFRIKGGGKKPSPYSDWKRSTRPARNYRSSGTNGRGFNLKWAWAIIVLIAAGIYAAHLHQEGAQPTPGAAIAQSDMLRATFSFCGEGRRVTCIVDGDTFWLSGERIRIADIDTPEINPPRCEEERIKGEAAKRRLRELLNAGPFSLVAGMRAEDQYGRKLRTVMRDGRSIGEMLVSEGLARRWDGARRSWCG
ncbi:nuclease-like protein [Aquamicrobium defluvii]|uniref:Nuclease-like protein n=1 Tax=Aquamicrobium defluvii TaxID=69279 RepID=A0A4V3DJS8_9HYPH|nr:nuclease-like protein [Aquamicrobium defluvii]